MWPFDRKISYIGSCTRLFGVWHLQLSFYCMCTVPDTIKRSLKSNGSPFFSCSTRHEAAHVCLSPRSCRFAGERLERRRRRTWRSRREQTRGAAEITLLAEDGRQIESAQVHLDRSVQVSHPAARGEAAGVNLNVASRGGAPLWGRRRTVGKCPPSSRTSTRSLAGGMNRIPAQ